jgi:DNA-binding PadR family transcriptional regulator
LFTKTVKKLRNRVIKNFLDILILIEMKDNPLSGYDVIGLIHKKYDVLLSSGTIYSQLYSLEREGIIRGEQNNRKRVYELTEEGEHAIGDVLRVNEQIQHLLQNLQLPNS